MGDLLGLVQRATAAAAPGAVVVSNSDWHEMQLREQRLPTPADLDPVSNGVPVVLVRGGHSFILNSAALDKYGITAQTPVPAGGMISRDDKGVLTGELVDTARAPVKLPPQKPLGTDDILATQRRLNPYGITAIRIPGASKGSLPETFRLARELAGSRPIDVALYDSARRPSLQRRHDGSLDDRARSKTTAMNGCASAA